MKIDKLLHFLAGFFMAAVLAVIFGPIAGVMLSILVGAGKEIVWDHFLKRGTPEVYDFIATMAGAIIWAGTYSML